MISKAFIYIPMSRFAGFFIFVVQLFFFRRSYIILFVSQGGSVLRTVIILFGICLLVRKVIRSVIFSAYVSISLLFSEFQSVSIRSFEKV